MAWFNRLFSFSNLCSEQFFLNSRLKFHNFTVSKQHTSGFMFQKHFSRTDQKTAPVHVLPRDALREHIHRHIQKILFQFHAKSWKSWKSIWSFKSNLLKESARSASRSRTWTKRCSTIFMHRMVRINRYDGTRFFYRKWTSWIKELHKLPANFNIFGAKKLPQLWKMIETKLEKKPICRRARVWK